MDKAVADFSEAIRLGMKDAKLYHYRACAYITKRQWDKAIADFTEAIQLDPRYADAYGGRGWTPRAERRPGRGDRRLCRGAAACAVVGG